MPEPKCQYIEPPMAPDMDKETLEDHLRKATRRSTARLPEDRVFALGRDLARELAAAHAETPPRHPSLEPADVAMVDGAPRLGAGAGRRRRRGPLPPRRAADRARPRAAGRRRPGGSTDRRAPRSRALRRRAILAGLAVAAPRRALSRPRRRRSPRWSRRSPAAAAAAPSWPMFRGDAGRTGRAARGHRRARAPPPVARARRAPWPPRPSSPATS